MKIKILLMLIFLILLNGCIPSNDILQKIYNPKVNKKKTVKKKVLKSKVAKIEIAKQKVLKKKKIYTNVWNNSQKNEFLTILKSDKYLSICNQKSLYADVQKSKNSKLMSKLLIAYSNNLANGCLNHNKLGKSYQAYTETIKDNDILRKLKENKTIKQILSPYIPKYRQFTLLTKKYKLLKNNKKTAKSTLKKVRLSIERLKIMKQLGTNYALVNIPEFKVHIIENDKTTVSMPVVVGKTKMQTPIFSSDLKYISLNPQWSVPDSIASKEIIPKLIKNPNYLKRRRMVVRKSYDLSSPKVDPKSVNWSKYSHKKGYLPYKFIEVPSKKNGLGRVKFIFPNKHAVYMHDTQSKYLFKRKVRAYSHGCVRLSKPKTMLDYISKNYTTKNSKEIKTIYDSLKTTDVRLNKRLAVHTVYLTAYVDKLGKLKLFKDIYRLDKSQQLNFK